MLSFERSTRFRDNVGSQNGTVSDPAEGTRDHTGREGAPYRRHQKEVLQCWCLCAPHLRHSPGLWTARVLSSLLRCHVGRRGTAKVVGAISRIYQPAGTASARLVRPVNCQPVNIYASLDGGNSERPLEIEDI